MKLPVPPRSVMVFLSKLKVFWRQWDVQTMVLTSFAMQLILILVAPFRKQTSNQIVVVSIWLAYLLADWVAAQGIGLIARPCVSMTSAEAGSAELYAFWAQFLLFHLGGPDTITALSLEDNELWLRTGLHLGVQVYGGLGVLVNSIAQYGSSLWVPTILMFIAGILKYLERVTSLFHGRVKLCTDKDLFMPILRSEVDFEKLTNVEMVRIAYCLFHDSKGLYADQASNTGANMSIFDLPITVSKAVFRVLEMQLNFTYEAFYTKAVIIHTSRSWKVLRFLVASLLVGCLAIWRFFTNKQGFLHYNVQITYTLLIGAIIAELLAFVRIQLSDWTIAKVDEASRIKIMFYDIFLSAYQKRPWERYWRKEDDPTWPYLRRLFSRRWSESISQLNCISMCMDKPRPDNVQKVIDFFQLKDVLDKHKYVSHKWFSDHLRTFIFADLHRILNAGFSSANTGHTKGGIALRLFIGGPPYIAKVFPITLKLFNIHWDYDMVLMRWHFITELCYITHGQSQECNLYREICKTLSDYLFYLLIYQPEMLPTVTATKGRSDVLKAFLEEEKEKFSLSNLTEGGESTNESRREFCMYICEVFRRREVYDLTEVAKFPINKIMSELEELENVKGKIAKWELMAGVWAELLYYAAIRCKPRLHAAKLKEGGELLSLVWMLMLQFGCSLDKASHSEQILKDTLDENPENALLNVPF